MKKQIIEDLRYSANLLGWLLAGGKGNWSEFNPDKNLLQSTIVDNNTVKYYWKNDPNGTYITFKNIRPDKISSTVYDDPKIISSEVKDAYSSTATNLSDKVSMNRSYSITEGTETSVSDSLGVSVALGISQSVSYGGELYGASGTTSISIDVETSFNHQWASGESESRTIDTSIEVPPRTKTTITATKNRSKLEQTVHYECDLDYTIEFESWGVAHFTIDSRGDLEKAFDDEYFPGLWYAKEGDGGAQEHANAMGRKFAGLAKRYRIAVLPKVVTKLDKTIKFDKSVTGEVVLKSNEIEEYIYNGYWDFVLDKDTNPKTYTTVHEDGRVETLTVKRMLANQKSGVWKKHDLTPKYR